MMIIKSVIFVAILIYASVQDIRTREVSNFVHVMILITAFIDTSPQDLPAMCLGALLVPLPLLVSALIQPNSIGGADIKLMAVCSFMLGFQRGMVAVIIGLTIGLFFTVIKRKLYKQDLKNKFPMIPCLAAGSIVAFLI